MSNFSFVPETSDLGYKGYTYYENMDITDLKDGKYTLVLYSAAFKGAEDGFETDENGNVTPKRTDTFYPETVRKISFIVDRKGVDFKLLSFERNLLKFTTEELSFVREMEVSFDGIDFIGIQPDAEGNYTVPVPQGTDMAKAVVRAVDGAYNKSVRSLDQIIHSENYGKVNILVKADNINPTQVEYKITDESGTSTIGDLPEVHLPFGKYTLEVIKKNPVYDIAGEKVFEFELTRQDRVKDILVELEKRYTVVHGVHVKELADLEWNEFDIYAVEAHDRNSRIKLIKNMNYKTGDYRYAELPYSDYLFELEMKVDKPISYKLYAEEGTEIPYKIHRQSQQGQLVPLRIVKDIYRIHINEKGLENVSHEPINYVAFESQKGKFVPINEVTEATYEVIPLNIPEGYYLKDAYLVVSLTEQAPEVTLDMIYEKDETGAKLTIKDNMSPEQAGEYAIIDYRVASGILKEGKEYNAKSNETVNVPKGKYLIGVYSNETHFGAVADAEGNPEVGLKYKIVTLDDPQEVRFVFTKYDGKSPEGRFKFNVLDKEKEDAREWQYEFDLIMTPTVGDPIEHHFNRYYQDTWEIERIPYGFYKLTVKDLKEGYKLNKDTFIIDQPYFEEVFYVIKDDGGQESGKEKVLITFDANGGSGSMPFVEVEKGTSYELPENEFTAPFGKKFYAWEIDGQTYSAGEFVQVVKNTEIKALWEKKTITPGPRPRPRPIRDEDKTKAKPIEKEQPMAEKPVNPLLIGKPTQRINLTDIPDTSSGDAIRNMVARGILVGMGNGRFEPKTTVTRAMISQLLMRMSVDKSIIDGIQFTDVQTTDWFSTAVKWAATHGLVNGYPDGSFKANRKITLQEFAVMLNKMLKEFKIEMPKIKEVQTTEYGYLPTWSKE